MDRVLVKRECGNHWWFEKDGRGFYHRTRQNTYRLFMDELTADIWIGRLCEGENGPCWCTWERQIGATEVHLFRGTFTFKR